MWPFSRLQGIVGDAKQICGGALPRHIPILGPKVRSNDDANTGCKCEMAPMQSASLFPSPGSIFSQ